MKITKLIGAALALSLAIAVAQPAASQQQSVSTEEQYRQMPQQELIKLADKKKDTKAMETLASMYLNSKDYKNAVKYLKKAGEAGVADCSYLYGIMQLNGEGTKRNTGGALKWITRAANDGNADAMWLMAKFYKEGLRGYTFFLGAELDNSPMEDFVYPNFATADEWHAKAIKAGSIDAIINGLTTHSMHVDKDKALQAALRCNDPKKLMTIYAYLETSERADEILERAAKSGSTEALVKLGDRYADSDYEKAKDYYTRAGSNKLQDLEMKHKAELAYQAAIQKIQSENEALYKKAEEGDPTAMYDFAKVFYKAKMYPLALKWFEKAAEKGNARAKYMLGACYYFGYGVKQTSYTDAFNYYKEAEAAGMANDPDLLYTLGFMYAYGQGTSRDIDLGEIYLKKAVKAGSKNAQTDLDKLKNNPKYIQNRRTTSYKVAGHTYSGVYRLAGTGDAKVTLSFSANGRCSMTTVMFGKKAVEQCTYKQNGTEITLGTETYWLDSKGNLHYFMPDWYVGDQPSHTVYYRNK